MTTRQTMNQAIIAEAQEFAARWGFITRDLFFEFFCKMSQAQQYRYWHHFVAQGFFAPSKANRQVLLLTKKSRARFADTARPARFSVYVEHDALVARVFLSFQKRRLIGKSWLEDELIRNPMDAYSVLGASRTHRIPDLVFDLKNLHMHLTASDLANEYTGLGIPKEPSRVRSNLSRRRGVFAVS